MLSKQILLTSGKNISHFKNHTNSLLPFVTT